MNITAVETVRACTRGFYAEVLTALPPIGDGLAGPMAGPGLGTELRPGLLARGGVTVRRTS